MKVYKFGGASIKDAEAVRNMCSIVKEHKNEPLLVVVSAMGKMTNALEKALADQRTNGLADIQDIVIYHHSIAEQLFDKGHEVYGRIDLLLGELKRYLSSDLPFNQHYDQVVSIGELLSSTIISAYLDVCGTANEWVDARTFICTDENYRNGRIDWSLTCDRIMRLQDGLSQHVILTQGFIGGTTTGFTTTLGREGSDFSAAIFASCLNADSLTVWKDVPGILNADPKLIDDAQLYDELHFKEAAEMTYYGASVIHPKTIKPLANKNIPLYVRSFTNPADNGTIIHGQANDKKLPTIIIKPEQCLVSFGVIDYTFINEENLSLIFQELAKLDVKINIMQNSAISFSIVIDYQEEKLKELIIILSRHFSIRYNTGLTLITIKDYQPGSIDKYMTGKHILLEQKSRNNYRALFTN